MKTLCLGCMQEFDDEYKICPHCGYAVGTKADEAIHIQPGTRLHDRYVVGKVLGFGGFGVTYIAWDEKLEQKVAIKEYLPSEFSTRMPGQTQVTVFNGEKNEQFHDGLSKFVDEAKRLAKFQNEPGIVSIFDSFEDNSTAYIIMEYLQGETLASYMERMGTIDEQDAVAMLMPIMESLQAVHDEGIIHRDIAPDNIFLTDDGEIKLIDFGASRYATTSHSRSLTVVIKQGYSPEEQYRSRGDHGPHTDVYALSATLYKMITGKNPPDAMERRVKYETKSKDILEDPRKFNKKLSKNRANAILNALNVRIEDRTPTVAAFIDELNADPPAKRIYGKIKLIDRLRWPLWLKITVPALFAALLTLAILLLTGVINFSKFSQDIVIPEGVVVVPEVEGMYTEEAVALITNGNLLASTDGTIESQYIPAGKIILQTPTGGSYMNINSTVVLTVSSGKSVVSPENGISTVPYVIWETKDDAIAKLIKAGLAEPEIVERHDDNVAAGAVIAQSINAGEKVDEGTKLTLTVSIGPAAFDMPNVVGQTKDKAESTLNGKGLVVTIEYKKDDSAKEGTVLAQSVAKGTSVKRGDEVTITIATNTKTVKVANVVGKSKSDAESILKDQGFKVTILENYDANIAAGKVISQSPEAGVSQVPGTEIVLYVSKGKQPISITLNANGGTVAPGSKTAYLSDTYGSLPTPTKEGYSFDGWYSSISGGMSVTSSTTITTPSSHSLYAHWTPNTYTVSFDSNGGGASPSSKKVTYGSVYGALGTVSRSGYTFVGWFTEKNGGKEVLADTKYTTASNQTLYAHWTEVIVAELSIKTKPSITEYYVGETLNTAGLTLTAKYNDGSSKTISSGFTCSPTSLTSSGTKTITVTYTERGKTVSTSFTVAVKPSNISGKINNVIWSIDDGTLTISGSGPMPNYTASSTADWRAYEDVVEKIVIQNGVTNIGEYAFYCFTSLTDITIPDSVTYIGRSALYNCKLLTTLSIPNGVTKINSETFYYCESLQNVTIPNSVTDIGIYAFSNCSALKSITIPSSVTSIYKNPFMHCSSLRSITVDANNKFYHAENNCLIETSTNTIVAGCRNSIIPDYVTIIGESAFEGQDYLESVIIPNGVTSIGNSAFLSTGITSIIIPDTVITIGDSAFYCCYSLKSITLPNSVKSIGSDSFYRCFALKSIVLPKALSNITSCMFRDSALKSITIPSSVTSIDFWAFMDCSSLESVSYEGTKSQWNEVNKGELWNDDAPFTVVHCIDGDVAV